MMGWEIVAAHVLQNVLKEGRILSAKDIEVFESIRDLLLSILSSNPRYCFNDTHKCEYREGACHVLFTKGNEWTAEDIANCKYRRIIE